MIKTKIITRMSILVTIALLLGYVESLFPPIVPIPGIKLGLANAVVILLLYTYSWKTTSTVSILRVILSTTLFGSVTSFLYSLSGAVVSLLIMMIAKKTKLFSISGVSSIGGIFHNIAQITCAYFFVGKGAILYIPILCVSGAVCGALTGIVAQLIIKRGRNLFGKE